MCAAGSGGNVTSPFTFARPRPAVNRAERGTQVRRLTAHGSPGCPSTTRRTGSRREAASTLPGRRPTGVGGGDRGRPERQRGREVEGQVHDAAGGEMRPSHSSTQTPASPAQLHRAGARICGAGPDLVPETDPRAGSRTRRGGDHERGGDPDDDGEPPAADQRASSSQPGTGSSTSPNSRPASTAISVQVGNASRWREGAARRSDVGRAGSRITGVAPQHSGPARTEPDAQDVLDVGPRVGPETTGRFDRTDKPVMSDR